jgi:hypothetical protein
MQQRRYACVTGRSGARIQSAMHQNSKILTLKTKEDQDDKVHKTLRGSAKAARSRQKSGPVPAGFVQASDGTSLPIQCSAHIIMNLYAYVGFCTSESAHGV